MAAHDHEHHDHEPGGAHAHGDGNDHGHDDHAGHSHGIVSVAGIEGRQRRALLISLWLNLGFLGAELVGGIVFGSLALLADAAHMLSDVAGLVVALIAARLARRPASDTHTWGWRRTEILGAQANAATLVAVAVWIVVAAVGRLQHPQAVESGGVLVVAALGLAANLVSAVLLARTAGTNLNMRGAFLHMAVDAGGSVAVIVSALAVAATGAERIDPLVSIGLALLVGWSAFGLLRQTSAVLLEATPAGVDVAEVKATLAADPSVDDVHHLHVWAITPEQTALSAHVVLAGATTLHEAQDVGDRLRTAIAAEHKIGHVTLELECHACPEPAHAGPADGASIVT